MLWVDPFAARFQSRLAQRFDKPIPIPIILENGISVVAPAHHACPAVALAKADGTTLPDTPLSAFAPCQKPKIRPQSRRVQIVRTDPCMTRRPAPGLLRLGFGAWRIACDKNGQPHQTGHVREKLFNDGKIGHHARSFRNQFRMVASRTASKDFV